MKRWFKVSVLVLSLMTLSDSYAWRELTITKTDSLTNIAGKYHPANVSRMDMVIAIRNANPHVFAKTSTLKPGVKLMLPTTQAEVREAIKGKAPAVTAAVPKADAAPLPLAVTANVPAKVSPKPLDKPVVAKVSAAPKKSSVATAPLAANQNAMMVKSLQDTVSSQTQAIQNYQSQINELNAQLNMANQQIQSLQAQVGHKGIFTLGNLWLALWLLTLGFLVVQQYRYKKIFAHDPETMDDEEDVAQAEVPLDTHSKVMAPEAHALQADELDDERQEPQLLSFEEAPKVKSLSENWEQVELDIPIAAPEPVVQEQEENAQLFERYDDSELAGQQDDIIKALSQDENNMEWHQALLEFYVKTNSQNGFKRHYQTMVKSGMMTEGDPLWEQVRKMCLNKWIYQAI